MGWSLKRRREEFLPETAEARWVLMLGEGDGRFLNRFLAVNATAHVDYVDASGEMLAVASARVASCHRKDDVDTRRVEFHHADGRSWTTPPGRTYDLIITHFFLDCFREDELAIMIPRLATVCSPDGLWIVSEFRQPPKGWAALRAKLWIRGLYTLFGWTTGLRTRFLPEFHPLLERAGFRLIRQTTGEAGMLVSELWAKSQETRLV